MLRNRLTDCFPPLPPLPPSSPYNYHQRGGCPNVNIISMSIYCKGFSSQTKRKSVPVIFIRLQHPIFAAAIITPNTFSIFRTVVETIVEVLFQQQRPIFVGRLVGRKGSSSCGWGWCDQTWGKKQHFLKRDFVQKWLCQFVRRSGNLLRVKSPPICKGSSSSCFDSGNISPPTIWKTTKSEK